MDKIEVRIRQVMADIFDLDIDVISSESSQDNIEKWDSISHLNLIVALEEEFEISIPMEDVGIMTNFKIVLAVINEQL